MLAALTHPTSPERERGDDGWNLGWTVGFVDPVLGAAHAPSPDVRGGRRARRSLHVRCASPSGLRLLP